MTETAVDVLIASRNPAYAAGLASFLGVGPFAASTAHTVDQALEAADRRPPALALIDWSLGDAPGAELASALAVRHPHARVVFCVPEGDGAVQVDALASGAAGVVLPTWTAEAVLEAVHDAMRGVGGAAGDAARSLSELVRRTHPRQVLLTDKERVVLRLMRQQLTYKEIALALGISWHTVRSHAQSILRKLGIHSRRDLDAWDARLASSMTAVAAGRDR